MALVSWPFRSARRRTLPIRFRPSLELLEERLAPASFLVTNNADNGTGSLRAAVNAANVAGGSNTLTFASTLSGGQTINLTSNDTYNPFAFGPTALVIQAGDNLTVEGSPTAAGVTISQNAANGIRLFGVLPGASLTLEYVTLSGGKAIGGSGGSGLGTGGGGASGLGGAIVNDGTLTILNSTLTGNTAQGGAGGYGNINAGGSGGGAVGGNGGITDSNLGGGGGGVGGPGATNYGVVGSSGGANQAGVTAGSGSNGTEGGGGGGGAGGAGGNGLNSSSAGFGGGGGGGTFFGVGGAGGFGGGGGGAGGGGPANPGVSGGSGGFGGGGGGGGSGCSGVGGPGGGGAGGFGAGSGGAGGSFHGGGGGGGAGLGGAIFNNGGTVTITNSTLSGNTAQGGGGGGAYKASAGNDGSGYGGAVFNYGGTLVINSSTLAGNTVSGAGTNQGGAIFNLSLTATQTATLFLFNSIVADSTGASFDLQNDQVAGSAAVNVGTHDLTTSARVGGNGTINGPIGTTTTAALNLGSLTNNGGPTATMLPGAGNGSGMSSAIGNGNLQQAFDYGLGADQRGVSRYVFTGGAPSTIDVGAVEVGGAVVPTSLVVTTTADLFDGNYAANLSLREAVYLANSGIGGGVVTFAADLAGDTLDLGSVGTLAFGPTGLAISGNVTIAGLTGSSGVTISQNTANGIRLFGVFAGAELTLQDLTLSGGEAVGGNGGAGGGGGGAGLGGAIFNNGNLTILDSTLSGNTAIGGNGGIAAVGSGGGAVGGGGGAVGGSGGNGGVVGGGGGGGVGGNGGNGSGSGGGAGGADQFGETASSCGSGYLGGGSGGNVSRRQRENQKSSTSAGFGGGGGGGAGPSSGNIYNYGGGGGGFGAGGGGGGCGVVANCGGFGGFGGGGGGGGFAGAGGSGGFGAGGGFYRGYFCGGGGGGGAGLGGAIFNNQGASLSITNSTLYGNTAEGGNGGDAINKTSVAGSAGSGYGGAVFNRDSTVTITSSTLADNIVSGPGTNLGGDIYDLSDNGSASAIVNLLNSILDSSSGTALAANQKAGTATVNAASPHINFVVSNTLQSGAAFNNAGVISSGPLDLSILTNNGGPTETMILGLGSVARGAGNAADAAGLTTDQRGTGFPRTNGGKIDLGALEMTPPSTVYVDADWAGTSIGANPATANPFTSPLSFGYNAFADIPSGIAAAGSNPLIIFGSSSAYTTAVDFNQAGQTIQINTNTVSGAATVDITGAVTLDTATIFSLSAFTPTTPSSNPADQPAGNLTFNSTINGGNTLSVDAASAGQTVTFGGAVGGTAALSSVTISANVVAALDGGSVNTTGLQVYNGAVVLGAATSLTSTGGGAITFGGTVDGAQTLTTNTSGLTTFSGIVGGSTSLQTLTIGGGGTTQLNGGSINTTGFGQNYNEDVTLGSAFTMLAGIVDFNEGLVLGSDTVQVAGSLNFTTTTTLTTTFTGTAPAQIGHILVGGGNTTYGNAKLVLNYSGFTPEPGDSFDVVSNHGFGIGQFVNAPAPGPDVINGISYLVTYSGSAGGGDFILAVPLPPTITSAGSTTFTAGTPGSFTITTTGFPLPTITQTGALPGGVTLADNGNGTATLDGTPTISGTFTLTITASNGTQPNAVQTFTLIVNAVPPPTPPVFDTYFAVGADAGGGPQVNVYNTATGALVSSFDAFAPSFTGGVRVAVDLINGTDDIICAAGPGGGPQIVVINGSMLTQVQSNGEIASAAVLASFYAFAPTFGGGVFVVAGTSSSGQNWIAAGAGAGGGPQIVVWTASAILAAPNNPTPLTSFYAFVPSFSGGVTVALGDVNGSGKLDVICGAGPGGGPQVNVVDGTRFSSIPDSGILPSAALLASFYAFSPSFTGGVFVSGGATSGSQFNLIIGAGPSGQPQVIVVNGAQVSQLASNGEIADSALLDSFFALSSSYPGGVRVGFSAAYGSTGTPTILTAAGPGGGPQVAPYDGATFQALTNFFAMPNSFTGGFFIAG